MMPLAAPSLFVAPCQVVQPRTRTPIWSPLAFLRGDAAAGRGAEGRKRSLARGGGGPPGRGRAPRVLCYGDSNTAGFCEDGLRFVPYGHTLSEALVAQGVPCKVRVCGLSGRTAEDMATHLDAAMIPDAAGRGGSGLRRLLREARPDVVVLMAGTNDLGFGATPEAALRFVVHLHDVCHGFGVPTVCVAPPCAPQLQAAQRRLSQLLGAFARMAPGVARFLDAEELLPRRGAGAALWEPDGLHFSPAGSRELGGHLALALGSLLRRPLGQKPLATPPWPGGVAPPPPPGGDLLVEPAALVPRASLTSTAWRATQALRGALLCDDDASDL